MHLLSLKMKFFIALDKLQDNIERTHLTLVDLEQQYIFQFERMNEQSSRLEACYHNFSAVDQETKRFAG